MVRNTFDMNFMWLLSDSIWLLRDLKSALYDFECGLLCHFEFWNVFLCVDISTYIYILMYIYIVIMYLTEKKLAKKRRHEVLAMLLFENQATFQSLF